jgi:hypothetical protein
MKGLEKCHKGRRLRWIQILPISRHIAAALQHLAHELVLRQSGCDRIEGRASLAAALPKRVAVVALLRLKDQRPLDL